MPIGTGHWIVIEVAFGRRANGTRDIRFGEVMAGEFEAVRHEDTAREEASNRAKQNPGRTFAAVEMALYAEEPVR